jgi:hypothetical protein
VSGAHGDSDPEPAGAGDAAAMVGYIQGRGVRWGTLPCGPVREVGPSGRFKRIQLNISSDFK